MKADPKADAAPPKSSKKKLLVIIAMGVLVLGGGGAAAWVFTHGSEGEGPAKKKESKVESIPVFVTVDPFTVNLQPENGEQYLQVQFSLQVPNLHQEEAFKQNMPIVRNRVVLLLSGKHASEITTVEGKHQLTSEIVAALKKPFAEKGEPQEITDVLYTSFIIQAQ